MRDTSLDEFLGEDADAVTTTEDGDERTDDGAPAGAEDDQMQAAETGSESVVEPAPESGGEAAPAVERDGATAAEIPVEPAVATYGWTPGGAECQECEETVERRWHDEARTVIAVLHDIDLVREVFPETLLIAREPVAWGTTDSVLHPENLLRARRMVEANDPFAQICERA